MDLPDTSFMKAVLELLGKIDASIHESFKGVVTAHLVGGVAVHIHTASRVSMDLDALFTPSLVLREVPSVTFEHGGETDYLSLDRNYTDVLAVMHPDWKDDCVECAVVGRLKVVVISPMDLAVSKVGRYGGNDRIDILSLAEQGLLDADAFEARCREALDYYVGDTFHVERNIEEAVEMVRVQKRRPR